MWMPEVRARRLPQRLFSLSLETDLLLNLELTHSAVLAGSTGSACLVPHLWPGDYKCVKLCLALTLVRQMFYWLNLRFLCIT